MKVWFLLLALAVIVTVLLVEPRSSVQSETFASKAWVASYDGPASSSDLTRDLAVDGAGNVYVTGVSTGSGTDADFATIKYGPAGNELWVARYDGPASAVDIAAALAVDGAGNVYVTGVSGGFGTANDIATVKYGPEGNEIWVARYDGPANGSDGPTDLVLDSAGNVYVTGSSEGDGTMRDYVTVKYDPDGSELWVARHDGASTTDEAVAIAVDGSGNVYVMGSSDPGGGEMTTIKYGPDGSEHWVRSEGRGVGTFGTALAIDGAGNVYVTGSSKEPRGLNPTQDVDSDIVTVKYGPDGTREWVALYDGLPFGQEVANSIAVDSSGNVVVAGYTQAHEPAGTGAEATSVSYGPDGSVNWVAVYRGPINSAAWGYLALDAMDNVYVAGSSRGSETNRDIAVAKYSPDGNEVWVTRYDGPASSTDSVRGLTTDGEGNVYITGYSAGCGTGLDYTTIRYEQEPKDASPNPPEACPTPGDANCDGDVNAIDAALVLQFTAGLLGSLDCEDNADVNESGEVTSIDATLILQFTAGLLDSLPP